MPLEFGSTRPELPGSVRASLLHHLGECALPSRGVPVSFPLYRPFSFCFLSLPAKPSYGYKSMRKKDHI